jgi:hypothetical protein
MGAKPRIHVSAVPSRCASRRLRSTRAASRRLAEHSGAAVASLAGCRSIARVLRPWSRAPRRPRLRRSPARPDDPGLRERIRRRPVAAHPSTGRDQHRVRGAAGAGVPRATAVSERPIGARLRRPSRGPERERPSHGMRSRSEALVNTLPRAYRGQKRSSRLQHAEAEGARDYPDAGLRTGFHEKTRDVRFDGFRADPLRRPITATHCQSAFRRMGQDLPRSRHDARRHRPARASLRHVRDERRKLSSPHRHREKATGPGRPADRATPKNVGVPPPRDNQPST